MSAFLGVEASKRNKGEKMSQFMKNWLAKSKKEESTVQQQSLTVGPSQNEQNDESTSETLLSERDEVRTLSVSTVTTSVHNKT